MKQKLSIATMVMVGLASVGCGGIFGGEDLVPVEVRLVQDLPATMTADILFSEQGAVAVPIQVGDVLSLVFTVDSIQFLPLAADDAESAWQSLDVDPVEIDLAALPTSGNPPLVVAAGALPAGDYRQVRLFVSGATITFANPISLGNAKTFDADTPYPVEIPSASNTGIKTDLSFSVVDDGMGNTLGVELMFEPTASYQNVNVTGAGTVMMAPVIKNNA